MDSQIAASSVSSDGISRKRGLEKSQDPNELSKRVCKSTSVLRQPLSESLFDHCFENIWKETPEVKRNQFTYINCFLFRLYTMKHSRERALTWIKKENIFSKRYVFVPINEQSHWSLLILCHFGESLKLMSESLELMGESLESKATTPCILFLDSQHSYDALTHLEPLIRDLVLDIFPESKDLVERIPIFVPEVPQQRNDKECGIYALYYTHLFLESAPQSFSSKDYPYFLKQDWFTEEGVEQFYEKLESLCLESEEEEEEVLKPHDFEGVECLVGDTWMPIIPNSINSKDEEEEELEPHDFEGVECLEGDTWRPIIPNSINSEDEEEELEPHDFEGVECLEGDTWMPIIPNSNNSEDDTV